MKVNEILNRKVGHKVVRADPDVFQTKGQIGDRMIHFLAELTKDETAWHVLFFQTSLDNKSMTFDASGAGGELEVFSMVKDSMMEFVDKYKPKRIEFTSAKRGKEASRSKLYDRLIKRLKPANYEYEKNAGTSEDYFHLIRQE